MPRESLSLLLVGGWAPTVDLQVHFLRPVSPAIPFWAVGRIISAGQTLVHAEASLTSKTTGKKLGCLHCHISEYGCQGFRAVMRDA